MKRRLEADQLEYILDLRRNGNLTHYTIEGDLENAGSASVERIAPGLYSILDGYRSFTVRLRLLDGEIEAWVGGRRFSYRVSDPRDRSSSGAGLAASGPQQIRAFMPGKVIKVLVRAGDVVDGGAGLIIVEAMKMQNEMKMPRSGRIAKIHVSEGATVGSGESLIEIE
jgi:acetyl/propionyl-CoA carboxylase alpha subunit